MHIHSVANNAPYPVTATMTSNGGKMLVQFAGSAWSSTGGKISVNLLMDGAVIATASAFTNEVNSHKALVPVAVVVSVTPGTHTFSVAAVRGTNVDLNDYFTITATETAPNHFEKGRSYIGYLVSSGWTLTSGTGAREWREPITFAKPFNSPPSVTVGFSMLDVDESKNTRVRVEAQSITDKGFELVCATWGDTIMYSIDADWLAFGDAQ
ncbi:H-type lectin domain-containing protein [Nocardia sp. NPDC127526]|uniref:H-type lectin domain-containing protein n=1 Tax=Nocardia sp. NPDC127526 TaxID=3345393 RepID=UPI0036373C3B